MNKARMLRLKSVCVAVIAMTLVGCGAPGGSQAVAGSAESTPEPDLLYQADWSSGIGGWAGGQDWKTLNGVLLNDGTGDGGIIFADFEAGSTADYAVEADVRVTRDGAGHFGIVVRVDGDGRFYYAGLAEPAALGNQLHLDPGIWDPGGTISQGEAFDPGDDWHTYRVETKGNVITLLVDGAVLAEAADNKYLEGGQVGLRSHGFQLEVRSFKVFAI